MQASKMKLAFNLFHKLLVSFWAKIYAILPFNALHDNLER